VSFDIPREKEEEPTNVQHYLRFKHLSDLVFSAEHFIGKHEQDFSQKMICLFKGLKTNLSSLQNPVLGILRKSLL